MNIIKLFTILTFTAITSSLRAMDNGGEDQWQEKWQNQCFRCPDSTRTMIDETIKDNAEEIIKRDLISIPEYRVSESRGAYSIQLLDLYKTHNPTSKHYQNAKKWALADAVTPAPIAASRAHQLLTNHPIASFSKDNPSDTELLWNIAAAAIVVEHNELKKQATILMNENQIPLPDSNFMTYLLSHAIITRDDSALDACADMGAKVEGIKKNSPFTPWIVADRKERDQMYGRDDLGNIDYSSPLDCAIRRANEKALIWLKRKQPKLFTDQVWLYHLKRYAEFSPYTYGKSPYSNIDSERNLSILAILEVNPNLELDQEAADIIYNNCSNGFRSSTIQDRVYPKTSWIYYLRSLLVDPNIQIIRPTSRARTSGEPHTPAPRPTTGEDAV